MILTPDLPTSWNNSRSGSLSLYTHPSMIYVVKMMNYRFISGLPKEKSAGNAAEADLWIPWQLATRRRSWRDDVTGRDETRGDAADLPLAPVLHWFWGSSFHHFSSFYWKTSLEHLLSNINTPVVSLTADWPLSSGWTHRIRCGHAELWTVGRRVGLKPRTFCSNLTEALILVPYCIIHNSWGKTYAVTMWPLSLWQLLLSAHQLSIMDIMSTCLTSQGRNPDCGGLAAGQHLVQLPVRTQTAPERLPTRCLNHLS